MGARDGTRQPLSIIAGRFAGGASRIDGSISKVRGGTCAFGELEPSGRAVEVLTTGGGDANHWLWLERPVDGITARRMPEPGVLRIDRFEPHPDCPVCPP